MPKLKIGFIGAGAICKVDHIPGIKALPEQVLGAALYDLSPQAADKVRRELLPEAKVYDSLECFLSAGLDAAIISTPNHTHHALTLACLNAGLYVLVEKPMASTLEEADTMIATARQNNRVLQKEHQPSERRSPASIDRPRSCRLRN